MAERVRVRELTNDECNHLLRIIRRGSGSVVRWRRAQIVLWAAQGMDLPQIAMRRPFARILTVSCRDRANNRG